MKSFKKVLKYFSVLILVLSLFGLGFTFLFAEKIEGIVLNKVNSKLKTGISVADIEFSVFANFPYASVTFSDIFIQDSNSDTLLFSKNSIIKLNVISLISGDYSVKNMEVQKGEINVKYDEKGIPNFNILKDTTKTDSDLNLDRILFTRHFTILSIVLLMVVSFYINQANNLRKTRKSMKITSFYD